MNNPMLFMKVEEVHFLLQYYRLSHVFRPSAHNGQYSAFFSDQHTAVVCLRRTDAAGNSLLGWDLRANVDAINLPRAFRLMKDWKYP